MKLKLWMAVMLVLGVGCQGAPKGWFEPVTKASYSPLWGSFSLYDTKDNDIEATGTYNKETGEFEFDVKIRNNASDVNQSQIELMAQYREQMLVFNEQMRIHGENIVNAFGRLNELASIVVGGATDILQTTVGPDGLKVGKAAGNQPMETVTSESEETP